MPGVQTGRFTYSLFMLGSSASIGRAKKIRYDAWTISGNRSEAKSLAQNIRKNPTVADPSRHGVDSDELAARDPSVLPTSASVRWASVFAITTIVALFAIISLARYPHVLHVSSADIEFEQDTVALSLPIARSVAKRLQVGQPIGLEFSTNTAQMTCRIEGHLSGMSQQLGAAPTSGPPIHLIRMVIEPSQRGHCRPLPKAHFEARIDLGSDSYASMFAAALFRR
jgi:hypothetical protein